MENSRNQNESIHMLVCFLRYQNTKIHVRKIAHRLWRDISAGQPIEFLLREKMANTGIVPVLAIFDFFCFYYRGVLSML